MTVSALVASWADLATLPPDCDALFAANVGDGLYSSRGWYELVIATALPPRAVPRFALIRQGGRSVALFPLQTLDDGRGMQSLTTPYTCLHRPLVAATADAAELHHIGRAFGRFCRGWPTVRLDALDAAWPGLAPLLAGIRAGGLVSLPFAHFGNWHEPVAGLSWEGYLARRPGTLRETIRRKLRKTERDPRFRFRVIRGGDEVEAGIAAYEDVCRQSWKAPEPFPRFNAALMRQIAALGSLRLGVLSHEGQPVAAQYWVVAGGRASLQKLAHSEALGQFSPGTVLTAMMVREMLQREAIEELDFGRGDDPYKRMWMAQRRQRVGVVLANPRRLGGLLAVGTRLLGRFRARLRPGVDGGG